MLISFSEPNLLKIFGLGLQLRSLVRTENCSNDDARLPLTYEGKKQFQSLEKFGREHVCHVGNITSGKPLNCLSPLRFHLQTESFAVEVPYFSELIQLHCG